MQIALRPNIVRIGKYPAPSQDQRHQCLRLDMNENTLPPPPHMQEALMQWVQGEAICMYPNDQPLLQKLAAYTHQDSKKIIVSNGSDQAIEIILRAFLDTGDKVLFLDPEFPMFYQIANTLGTHIIAVPRLENLEYPKEAVASAITDDLKLIVFANPGNPTGKGIPLEEIEKILKTYPHTAVLIDEAYYEFTQETALDLMAHYENLIITRTFSKAFSMAGLRLGYILAQPFLIENFYKIRGPFDVNACAIAAGCAQLDHLETMRKYVDSIMKISKPFLEQYFKDKSVAYYPAVANFMLVKDADPKNRYERLKANNVLVRQMLHPRLKGTFRMSLGNLEQMKQFVEVFEKLR